MCYWNFFCILQLFSLFQCKGEPLGALFFSRCGHSFHQNCIEDGVCIICLEKWVEDVQKKSRNFNQNLMKTPAADEVKKSESGEVEEDDDEAESSLEKSNAEKENQLKGVVERAETLRFVEQQHVFISECQKEQFEKSKPSKPVYKCSSCNKSFLIKRWFDKHVEKCIF